MSTQANHLLCWHSYLRTGKSPPSVLTREVSSDCIYHKKGINWRTDAINANSIIPKKAEISAMVEYCDPDLMLITETTVVFTHRVTWARLEGIDTYIYGGEVMMMIVTKD